MSQVIDAKSAAVIARNADATAAQLARAAGVSEAADRVLAKHPNASAALLERLSHSSDKPTRKNVVVNANASKDVLLRLAPQFPGDFFKNPAFDWLLLEDPNLLLNLGQGVLKNILKRPGCPESFMKWAAERGSEQERLAVAMNPEASVEVLRRLADKGGPAGGAAQEHVKMLPSIDDGDLDAAFREEVERVIARVPPDDVWGLYRRELFCEAQWPALLDVARLDRALDRCGDRAISILLANGRGTQFLNTVWGRSRIAASSSAPPEILSQLAKDTTFEICDLILENRHAGDAVKLEILRDFATDPDADVRAEAANNPLCTVEILRDLAADVDSDIRAAAAEHPNCTVEILQMLSTDKEPVVQLCVAGHIDCPTAIQRQIDSSLASNKDAIIRSCLASRLTHSEALLATLARDKDDLVREGVARNAECPSKILAVLATDKSAKVRCAVVDNKNCPASVLVRLANDSARSLWGQAAVWGYVVTNPNCPTKALEKVARLDDKYHRRAVANHGNASAALLEALSRDEDRAVRGAVAGSSKCPQRTLLKLAQDEDLQVRCEVAKNPACPPKVRAEILDHIALTGADSDVMVEVLMHPAVSAKVVSRLSQNKAKRVRQAIASRLDCPVACLKLLASDESLSVRSAVANNKSCPKRTLRVLANDDALLKALAANPACPGDLLRSIWSRLLEVDYGWAIRKTCEILEGSGSDDGAPRLPPEFIDRVRQECEEVAISPRRSLAWQLMKSGISTDALLRACEEGDVLFILDKKAQTACNNRALAVRLLGLSHGAASPMALAKRCKSVEWIERMAVARNANTPLNILRMLTEDPHRLVASQARTTLSIKVAPAKRLEKAFAPAAATPDGAIVEGGGGRDRKGTHRRSVI